MSMSVTTNMNLERGTMATQKQNQILEEAIETVDDGGEVVTFLRLGGKVFPVGGAYSGENRVSQGQEYRDRLKESLKAFYNDMRNGGEDHLRGGSSFSSPPGGVPDTL